MHRKKFWKNIISIFSLSILWYLMDMRAIYYIAISLSIYVLYALIRYRENNRVIWKINSERRLRGSKTALCIDANIQAKKVPLSLLRVGTFWGPFENLYTYWWYQHTGKGMEQRWIHGCASGGTFSPVSIDFWIRFGGKALIKGK